MILKLSKKEIIVMPMAVPENAEHIHVSYMYEPHTRHLKPILIFLNERHVGHKPVLSLSQTDTVISVRVLLVDATDTIIKEYTGNIPQHRYVIWGDKPVRPDFETYIQTLEQEIERLKNEGEVI
jgi:hypothetical protein